MITQEELTNVEALEITSGLFELDYEDEFLERLQDDSITAEWLEENAIWLQLENESDEAYSAFKKFLALPIDKWALTAIRGHNKEDVEGYYKLYYWKKRRLFYIKYLDWYERKRQEMEHLNSIAMYRVNQAKILQNTSNSALTLIEKIQKRIDDIDPDEIKVSNIPQFINSLGTFVNLAADAEARALAVDKLLQIHAEELVALDLKQHLDMINAGEHNEPI